MANIRRIAMPIKKLFFTFFIIALNIQWYRNVRTDQIPVFCPGEESHEYAEGSGGDCCRFGGSRFGFPRPMGAASVFPSAHCPCKSRDKRKRLRSGPEVRGRFWPFDRHSRQGRKRDFPSDLSPSF